MSSKNFLYVNISCVRDAGGLRFWACGYYAGTVGLDEGKIKAHIRNQETNESIGDEYYSDPSAPF